MNFNYEKARNLMVENQLRPNRIKNPLILNLFREIPKENFIPKDIKTPPYSDLDINLAKKRGYLKNLHIAQLINFLEINQKHKILHIGALTGYTTTLLAKLCTEVIAIETNEKLRDILNKNINDHRIKNIKIVEGSLIKGCEKEFPYDRILIDSPIKKVNSSILNQLNNKLGKLILIEKNRDSLNHAIRITKNNNEYSKEYLFDVFTKYELYEEKEVFKF